MFRDVLPDADVVKLKRDVQNYIKQSPHVDRGGIERWEGPKYRSCYRSIFQDRCKENDFFNGTYHVCTQMSPYKTTDSCSTFCSWQGRLSLSSFNLGERGLLVNPFLKFATSYCLLRSFFT